tara:strand:- start:967 stop:1437 length:471 start_codon:yes stop_codon:yes gene_type:complete
MTNEIRLVQFFDLTDAAGSPYLFQNYFIEGKQKGNKMFNFAPFQVIGETSSIGGDNSQIQVLFPATQYAIALVEAAKGNRESQLQLTTKTVNADSTVQNYFLAKEFYIGLGATFSEDTIELRFNTAIDAVGSSFPARRLSEDNVGILPLDSALSLR